MAISFGYNKSRLQLETKGFVYTLRLVERKRVGKTWYNYSRNDIKRGDVYIEFIGYFLNMDEQLDIYVEGSGFNSLKQWLKRAGKSRYLYQVELLKRWS